MWFLKLRKLCFNNVVLYLVYYKVNCLKQSDLLSGRSGGQNLQSQCQQGSTFLKRWGRSLPWPVYLLESASVLWLMVASLESLLIITNVIACGGFRNNLCHHLPISWTLIKTAKAPFPNMTFYRHPTHVPLPGVIPHPECLFMAFSEPLPGKHHPRASFPGIIPHSGTTYWQKPRSPDERVCFLLSGAICLPFLLPSAMLVLVVDCVQIP